MSERESLLQRQESNEASASPRDGKDIVNTKSLPPELQDLKSNAMLKAQGHEAEMKRSFSLFAALGLGFSITNSWVGYLSCFGQNLVYAGPNSVVFGLLVAVIIQWIISLGLYEIASCFPSSGGQYHFVFILAPPQYRQSAAFAIGWMNILGWAVATCSAVSCVVSSISGLIAFWNPTFTVSQLQSYIVYVCVAVSSASPVFLCPRVIPKILQASLIFSVVGFIVILSLLLSLRQQSQPLSFLFDTEGQAGWSPGIAWALGVGNAMYPFTCTDAAIHIAEEMVLPEKRLPQVVMLTLAMGFATAFPLLLVMMLSTVDMGAVRTSALPYAEIFYQITRDKWITTFMICWVTIALFSALIGEWITCGRLVWAFARDGGLPFSSYFSHVSKLYGFPVRTTLLALAFCCVYGLLYLVSTTAFNSIVTSAVLFSNITYCIPQVLVVLRGRRNVLPGHKFDLKWAGRVCNVLSPLLVVVVGILICFPPELPLTKSNINYTPMVLVASCIAIPSAWRLFGNRFEGPKIDWDILRNIKIP